MKITIETDAPLYQRFKDKTQRILLERELARLLCAQVKIVAMQAGKLKWEPKKLTHIELDVAPDEMYEGAACSITGE